MITIGSTSADTVVASNDTGSVGTTAEPIISFADYFLDPDNTGALSYQTKFRISIIPVSGSTVYWSITDNSWVTSASQGINQIVGTVQEQ